MSVSQPEILIMLPTLNEEPTVGRVIDEIPRKALEGAGYRVGLLVVDGNSSDRTREIAAEKGASIIKETIFENRFIHVSELKRMGADITINGNQAMVRGRDHLLAAPVMATDLRASASLVLAGLAATGGKTEVSRIYHLDRGYDSMEKKFMLLGARIWREKA